METLRSRILVRWYAVTPWPLLSTLSASMCVWEECNQFVWTVGTSTKHLRMQVGKQPWTPLSAVRRCLAAAERHSMHSVVVRPELQEMIDKIVPSLRETVLHGTSNSFALVGPHGCGKSLVCPFRTRSNQSAWYLFAAPMSVDALWVRSLAAKSQVFATSLTSGAFVQALNMALQQVKREPQAGGRPQAVTVHLSGALHSDKRRALKFVARTLCEYCEDMKFHGTASVEENEVFLRQVLAQMGRCRAPVSCMPHDFHRAGVCVHRHASTCNAFHQLQHHFVLAGTNRAWCLC